MMTREAFAARLKQPPEIIDFLASKNFIRKDDRSGLYDEFQYARVVRSNAALNFIHRFHKEQNLAATAAKQATELSRSRDLPGRRDNLRNERQRLDEQQRVAEAGAESVKQSKNAALRDELSEMKNELSELKNMLQDVLNPIEPTEA